MSDGTRVMCDDTSGMSDGISIICDGTSIMSDAKTAMRDVYRMSKPGTLLLCIEVTRYQSSEVLGRQGFKAAKYRAARYRSSRVSDSDVRAAGYRDTRYEVTRHWVSDVSGQKQRGIEVRRYCIGLRCMRQQGNGRHNGKAVSWG